MNGYSELSIQITEKLKEDVKKKEGILFEYFDENMSNSWTVSVEEFVKSWQEGATYGDK